MILEQKEITRINNYLVAIRALCETARNENTDSIIQLLNDIENITYREEKENAKLNDRQNKAKEIILKLYNAGRDVLMCRTEEKAYDNLSEAINDRSIERFLKEVEK